VFRALWCRTKRFRLTAVAAPQFLVSALVMVAILPSHSGDIVTVFMAMDIPGVMLWRFLCNVWHLLFIVWTYLVRMSVGCSKTAEYEFAVLTAVQLRMSESLNVAPCSLMGASRRFEGLNCLHIQVPWGPSRYGHLGPEV
jgi:hypothetical protein